MKRPIIIALACLALSSGLATAQPPTPPPAQSGTPRPTTQRPTTTQRPPRQRPRRNQLPAQAPTNQPPAPRIPEPDLPVIASSGRAVDETPGEKEFNQCKKYPAGQSLKLNLKPDTEVSDLIGWMSSITCTPFLVPSTVSVAGKKVTVIAPQAMSPSEAYRLFYAALESVGLTVEPSGKFLRIIDTGRARMTKLPFYNDDQRVPQDKRFITKLVHVENLDTNELLNTVLNRVKGEWGDIISYRSSLIITDTADNVERMMSIIKEFDVPTKFANESLWVVKVRNMSATEMASRLGDIVPVQQMSDGRRAGGGAPAAAAGAAKSPLLWTLPGDLSAEMSVTKIVTDERSNSLFVVANKRAFDWLITLIRRMDQPIDSAAGGGKVHIYHCEHANCDELSATLSAVAGVTVSGTTGGARRTRTSTPGAPPQPAPIPQQGGQGQQGNAAMLFEGDVRITFDAPTNSLLVVSSYKDFQALRKVIEKLDAPRKQVFIEALILEVLLDKTREVGVAYHGGSPLNFPGSEQSLLIGGFEASKTLNPAGLISSLGGLTGALFGPTIPAQNLQIFGSSVQLPSFGAFLQLLQTNNDVNVLSNPSLLITNNNEGEISVGENLPFPGQLLGGFGGLPGQQGGLGGLGIPSVGVQRQDVALRMKIAPSVNDNNMIRMEVDQEISDVSAPNFNGLGPATSKRSAKTTVVARDQQTVVIGGLMTDRATETVKKIPVLGDIPVLGFFFRSTSKTMKKSNIIIALTPYVISDLADLRRVAEKKLRERREFIDRYSALDDKTQIEANIDYKSKRGMLEEINRTARELEAEEVELRQLRDRERLEDTVEIAPPGRTGPNTHYLWRRPVPSAQAAPAAPGPTPASTRSATPVPPAPAPPPTTPPPAPTPPR